MSVSQELLNKAAAMGVAPMIPSMRPDPASLSGVIPPAATPTPTAQAPATGDSPALLAAINEIGRTFDRNTGRPERPLNFEAATEQMRNFTADTVAARKAKAEAGDPIGNAVSNAASWVNDKRKQVGGALGEGAYTIWDTLRNAGPDAFTGPQSPPPAPTPTAEAPAGGGIADKLRGAFDAVKKSPYTPYAAAGVGGAGLLGLMYAMSRRKKKQQNQNVSDEEMPYAKAAEEADAYYNKQPEKMNTYDASEGVKGLTPKIQEESHKKCSPGEFGMNKEGAESLTDQFNKFMNTAVNTPSGEIYFNRLGLGGAMVGGLGGALTAPKGKMLKRTMMGAGLGAVTGLGAGAGASLGMNIAQGPRGRPKMFLTRRALDRANLNEAIGGTLGLLGGGVLTHTLANKAIKEIDSDDAAPEKAGSFAFGKKMANNLISPEYYLPAATAAVGAGVGALSSKKNRLRNALIGAGVGGAGGYAAEKAMPGLGAGLTYRAVDALSPNTRSEAELFGRKFQMPTARDAQRMPGLSDYAAQQPNGLTGLNAVYPDYFSVETPAAQ